MYCRKNYRNLLIVGCALAAIATLPSESSAQRMMTKDASPRELFNSSVPILERLAAERGDSCLRAAAIAVRDRRVRELMIENVGRGNIFKGLRCPAIVGIPENVHVLFDFECPPDVFCLLRPWFLVTVNVVEGKVVDVENPYIPRAREASKRNLLDHASSGAAKLTPGKVNWNAFRALDNLASPRGLAINAGNDVEATLPAPQRLSGVLEANTQLVLPDEIRPNDPARPAELTVDYVDHRIGDDPVHLRSYNGKLVGPTIRAKAGDTLYITLKNDLPDEPDPGTHGNEHHGWNTTNLHTHGLHVAPQGMPDAESDNVLLKIAPGESQKYAIKIPDDHVAGTFWYHAHKHGAVSAQVSSGMAGTLIIERDERSLDDVPEIKAAREQILVLQQVPYLMKNGVGQIELGSNADLFAMFGPGQWHRSDRYTTINGQQIPVIRLRPGEVQRWRMVHSGVREVLRLRINKITGDGADQVSFHEISVDGLPLGKVNTVNELELWPGYRSDALVKAPANAGTYVLVDETSPARDSLLGDVEPLKYVAKVIVSGDPLVMRLPSSDQVAQYRLPSIPPQSVTGTQEAIYGITAAGFVVNGREYDPNDPRSLVLGAVEEWTIGTRNAPGIGAAHPFHIHVNPFEVFSIRDRAGRETLREPIWRDTIAMPQGYTIRFRTRYEKFTGRFVNHCHILDHEDQGMMELVEITAPNPGPVPHPVSATESDSPITVTVAKPALNPGLFDEERLADTGGRPTVALFVLGDSCQHCNAQLAEFAKYESAFRQLAVRLVCINAEASVAGSAKTGGAFQLLADPDYQLFRRMGCFRDGPQHATMVLDRSGAVRWRIVGDEPFMNVPVVLRQVERLVPRIEMEVRNTEADEDDYVTWAPAPCRIRVIPDSGLAGDLNVVLTNDPPHSIPPDSDTPPDGDLLFAATLTAGTTAENETLALRLPADGSWVPFHLAGKFSRGSLYGRASSRDKDAIVEVHEDTVDGPLLHQHALMVRVRKDARRLSDHEKEEVLAAISHLHMDRKRFEWFVELHNLGTIHEEWSDQAHKDSAFLPWHRAFLLQLERELQKTHPHVTIPYWVQDQASPIFAPDQLGTNVRVNGGTQTRVIFARDNPLYGWNVSFLNLGLLERSARDHTKLPTIRPFQSESQLLFAPTQADAYHPFRRRVESNPHNNGHGFIGEWMANCRTSPADPVFWVFHCHHDHLWARWQWYYDRYRSDSQDPKHYAPHQAYVAGDRTPLGHHLPDTMWPWDGTVGEQIPDDFRSQRPDKNDFGKFPAASLPFLWPQSEAGPAPGTMIDYQGMQPGNLDMGMAYDDTPFGARPTSRFERLNLLADAGKDAEAARFSLDVLTDRAAAPENRLQAATNLQVTELPNAFPRLRSVVRDESAPAAVRSQAIGLLATTAPEQAVGEMIELLGEKNLPGEVAVEALETTGRLMHFEPISVEDRAAIRRTWQEAVRTETRPGVLAVALRQLAKTNDELAGKRLAEFLNKPDSSPLETTEVISLLRRFRTHRALLRERLQSPNRRVAVAALYALDGDEASRKAREGLVSDRAAPQEVRVAAIHSVMYESLEAADAFLKVLQDRGESAELRAEASAALRVALRANGEQFPAARLAMISEALRTEQAAATPDSELRRLLDMAIETIMRLQQAP